MFRAGKSDSFRETITREIVNARMLGEVLIGIAPAKQNQQPEELLRNRVPVKWDGKSLVTQRTVKFNIPVQAVAAAEQPFRDWLLITRSLVSKDVLFDCALNRVALRSGNNFRDRHVAILYYDFSLCSVVVLAGFQMSVWGKKVESTDITGDELEVI